jgi:DNA polymerase-4
LACDVLARFMRLDGAKVFFLTGTDEHGQKVEKSAIKAGLNANVGECLTASIGVASNRLLAKMAADMKKPDGLTILTEDVRRARLERLPLSDIPGVGRAMEKRLAAAGLVTMAQLLAMSPAQARGAWGSVWGERLHRQLQGHEVADVETQRRSIGHSHVLPPESRHPDKAWPILCKLLHKACERLRSHELLAGSRTMQIAFLRSDPWAAEVRAGETDSTLALMRMLDRLWRERPEPGRPLLQVGVVLSRLCEKTNHTPSLFETVAETMASFDNEKQKRLDQTIDKLRARYGRKVVYFGGIQESRDAAPMRISFNHIPDLGVERD